MGKQGFGAQSEPGGRYESVGDGRLPAESVVGESHAGHAVGSVTVASSPASARRRSRQHLSAPLCRTLGPHAYSATLNRIHLLAHARSPPLSRFHHLHHRRTGGCSVLSITESGVAVPSRKRAPGLRQRTPYIRRTRTGDPPKGYAGQSGPRWTSRRGRR